MRPTNYKGQVIDQNTKAAIEGQFAGEFLHFTPEGDHFVMQAKLPDFGKNDAGEQFQIRKNMNYFMRGIANYCLDENGEFDLDKADGLLKDWFPDHPYPSDAGTLARLAETLQIPEKDREDFARFANTMESSLRQAAFYISGDFSSSMRAYQYNLEHYDDPEFKTTRQRLLAESYEDYKNTLSCFAEMAHMEVDTEKRMLLPLDCRQYAFLNQELLPHVKRYKEIDNEVDVGGPLIIDLAAYNVNGVMGGKENKFAEHYCTALKVELDGKEQVISLETTAPPAGKLLFAPDVSRTGVGIYDSNAQLEQYHADNNLIDIPSQKEYLACRQVPTATMESVKKCPASTEIEREQPLPKKPNGVKRWLNRVFGWFKQEVDDYNKAVSKNDMVRKTKQLSEEVRLSKLTGVEQQQERQTARLQRKDALSRQHTRLNEQLLKMKKANIRNIGYYTQTGTGGLSDLRNIASRAIFVDIMEELYTKGSPQMKELVGALADSGPQAMENLFETWKKSNDHEGIVDHYIRRAANAASHTIPLTEYLGREDCQVFTNAQKNKEETYGQTELAAYERFTQKCLKEYDDMKKQSPVKMGEMVSNLEIIAYAAKTSGVAADAKTTMKKLAVPQTGMKK